MKRVLAVLMSVCLLSGCRSESDTVGQVMDLRARIAGCQECRFTTLVTADYGESIYTFSMNCKYDKSGQMDMTVTAPDTISGITAQISQGTGKLTFDDQALMFEMVADGQISPICAAWLVTKALTGGYISSSGMDEEHIRVRIDDSFEGVQFSVETWLGTNNQPVRAEILWQGRRILSLDINEFVIV